jgi:hypothetical protein
VPSGPRWLPASPTAFNRSFVCEPHRISYRGRYVPGPNNLGLRLTIDGVSVNGRRMPRWWLDFLNNELAAYPSPPELTPQCAGPRIQLLLRSNSVAEVRTRAVDLPEPYR